jgi:hypothetical protein
MRKRTIIVILFLPFVFLLCSWGSDGHYAISYRSSHFMPQAFLNLSDWADTLALHASDADDRKSWDPTESPKHYIDIDNYPVFVNSGKIPQTYDSIIQSYGTSFVENNGTLPWSTKATYDSIKNNFTKGNWHKVMYFASDLGHYVGDGHQPLHITSNYDGQNSGQSGVHSRFETSLIYRYLTQIQYTGDTIHFITNVNQFIFDYIYKNNGYVDSVLAADLYAYQLVGSHNGTAYYTAFWSKAGSLVNKLWRNASKSLAELLYTAWIEGGSPIPPWLSERSYDHPENKWMIFPDPSSGTVNLQCNSPLSVGKVVIHAYDCKGKCIGSWIDVTGNTSYTKTFDLTSLSPGLYIFKMELNNSVSYKKVILRK